MKRSVLLGLAGAALGLIVGFAGGRLWPVKDSGPTAVRSGQDVNDNQSVSDKQGGSIVRLSAEQISEFGIEVEQAGPAKLQTQRTLTGQIVLDPDRVAYVVPRVSGIAVQINKTVGDPIREREVIAVIDSRELADAKAGYLAATERLSLAQASFDREKMLREKKISSEEDYLNAKQALAEAGIAMRNARQSLYTLGFDEKYLAGLSKLPDSSYTRYEVRAPFAGVIMDKRIGLGEIVTNTSQICQIADLSTVWAELTVYQKDLGAIHEGQTVAIRADDLHIDVSGTIEYISPVIEPSTRTAVARVVIENPKGKCRPGTFVTGRVDVGDVEVPVTVTRGAVLAIDGEDAVFVQTNDGFEPCPVQTGRTDPARVEILSGLEAGRRYVSANAFTLKAELSKDTFAGGDDD